MNISLIGQKATGITFTADVSAKADGSVAFTLPEDTVSLPSQSSSVTAGSGGSGTKLATPLIFNPGGVLTDPGGSALSDLPDISNPSDSGGLATLTNPDPISSQPTPINGIIASPIGKVSTNPITASADDVISVSDTTTGDGLTRNQPGQLVSTGSNVSLGSSGSGITVATPLSYTFDGGTLSDPGGSVTDVPSIVTPIVTVPDETASSGNSVTASSTGIVVNPLSKIAELWAAPSLPSQLSSAITNSSSALQFSKVVQDAVAHNYNMPGKAYSAMLTSALDFSA